MIQNGVQDPEIVHYNWNGEKSSKSDGMGLKRKVTRRERKENTVAFWIDTIIKNNGTVWRRTVARRWLVWCVRV